MRELDLDLTEGRVRVRVLGRGRPVLFLHGVSAHGRSWRAVAESLTARNPRLECWLPDLLGRGESDAPPEATYTLLDEVRRAREVARALCLATGRSPRLPPVIVGHSHGAAIALALSAAARAVRGLVLSNPVTHDIGRPLALAPLRYRAVRRGAAAAFAPLRRPLGRLVLRRAAGPHFRPSAEMVRAYVAPYADRRRARALMRVLADWRPSELAASMPERALVAHVVAGAHDPRIPEAAAERLALALGARYTRVSDGGHVLPEQHPARLIAAIEGVLERVEGERDG